MNLKAVIDLMMGFADRTGVTSDGAARRYLWTDAFAVCTFLGLSRHRSGRRRAHARRGPARRRRRRSRRPKFAWTSRHYFQAVLPAQFDEYVWFDETRAVTRLARRDGRSGSRSCTERAGRAQRRRAFGARGEVAIRGFGRFAETILACEPGARFAFTMNAGTSPLARQTAEDYRVTATDGGARLEWTLAAAPTTVGRAAEKVLPLVHRWIGRGALRRLTGRVSQPG